MISPAAAFFHVISITYSSLHISWKAAGTVTGLSRPPGLFPAPQGPAGNTWTPLLAAGFHFLSGALAGVALRARGLAHAEATLPARVTSLGAQAP